MKATWNNQTIASADKDQLIYIEGNWYFPPTTVNQELLVPSDHHTVCHWKGDANYYDIVVDGQTNKDAVWYYPHPMDGSIERVRKDFTNYIAFWHGVTVG